MMRTSGLLPHLTSWQKLSTKKQKLSITMLKPVGAIQSREQLTRRKRSGHGFTGLSVESSLNPSMKRLKKSSQSWESTPMHQSSVWGTWEIWAISKLKMGSTKPTTQFSLRKRWTLWSKIQNSTHGHREFLLHGVSCILKIFSFDFH